MNIYLIRHGRTLANERHIYCGQSDLPITEESAAEITESKSIYPSAKEYYTSGMTRTEQTFRCIYGDLPHTAVPQLKEIHFGDFELRSYDELKDTPTYQEWISGDNHKNICPNGESGEQMTERVLTAFRAICARGKDAVIVTHGGVIAAIMMELFPHDEKNRFQWQPAPAHGYAIVFSDDGAVYRDLP